MFNLGTGELLIIFLVILLHGAKRLPELARGLGKGINEFKDAVETGKKDFRCRKRAIKRKLIHRIIHNYFNFYFYTYFRN